MMCHLLLVSVVGSAREYVRALCYLRAFQCPDTRRNNLDARQHAAHPFFTNGLGIKAHFLCHHATINRNCKVANTEHCTSILHSLDSINTVKGKVPIGSFVVWITQRMSLGPVVFDVEGLAEFILVPQTIFKGKWHCIVAEDA